MAKQVWHVKVEDHFPCRDKFFLSGTFLTCKDERGAFTPQEFYRLKKILCDLRKVLLPEDEEKRERDRVKRKSLETEPQHWREELQLQLQDGGQEALPVLIGL